MAIASAPTAERRDHGLVGKPFTLVLRGHLVARCITEHPADRGRGCLVAGQFHADRISPATSNVDAKPVRRSLSAGADSPVKACSSSIAMPSITCPSTGTTSPVWMTIGIPFFELVGRNLNRGSVAIKPCVPGLLAERTFARASGIVRATA